MKGKNFKVHTIFLLNAQKKLCYIIIHNQNIAKMQSLNQLLISRFSKYV